MVPKAQNSERNSSPRRQACGRRRQYGHRCTNGCGTNTNNRHTNRHTNFNIQSATGGNDCICSDRNKFEAGLRGTMLGGRRMGFESGGRVVHSKSAYLACRCLQLGVAIINGDGSLLNSCGLHCICFFQVDSCIIAVESGRLMLSTSVHGQRMFMGEMNRGRMRTFYTSFVIHGRDNLHVCT